MKQDLVVEAFGAKPKRIPQEKSKYSNGGQNWRLPRSGRQLNVAARAVKANFPASGLTPRPPNGRRTWEDEALPSAEPRVCCHRRIEID